MAGWQKALIAAGLLAFVLGSGVFVYYYVQFARVIDARLNGEIFNNGSLVFAAPTRVRVGDAATPGLLAARLRKAFYTEAGGGSNFGSYKLAGDRLEIYPGPASFFQGDIIHGGPVTILFGNGVVASLITPDHATSLDSYWLEPEVITTVFDSNRSKRRLVRYQDIPKVLVDAVLATEDHRFFSHHGVNFFRIIGAALADLRADERVQGGSTLTMQLARNFFLTPERTYRRKLAEVFFALLLEQRLSKEQIFELYANQIYLGQRGSFSIYGFGEAAEAYFNKEISSLNLREAALLAGLIRGPSLYSPYRHASRALERRNYVLHRMAETEFITVEEAERNSKAPLGLAQQNVEASQAPFFVDMVREQMLSRFTEQELLSQSYRIYTTLDLDLQRAASEGARAGVAQVDQLVKKQRRPKNNPRPDPNQPQFALVALDPRTGEVRALVGGRDYALSQLNHALARRQPGSSFKPFVYAAALNSGVDGSQPLVTPATILRDEPTSFEFGDETYEPGNYQDKYHGAVTVRQALMLSLNVATVELAEMIGYSKVRALAIDAGINHDLGSTPALALGAYVATPLEIAGAYTTFANSGLYVAPRCILAVNDTSGHTLWSSPVATRRVLDPRVNYLMVSLLESVINNGTGYGVRDRGLKVPTAGKTGTSHDGWFAGFTSNLLGVVWVGYDDDRELNLSGASSALPLWTEFMKRAVALPAYRDCRPFGMPEGIVTAAVDPPANSADASDLTPPSQEIFIAGTEPSAAPPGAAPAANSITPPAHLTGAAGVLTKIFHLGKGQAAPADTATAPTPARAAPTAPAEEQGSESPPKPKKSGPLKKIISIFKGSGSRPEPQPQPAKKPGT